MNKRLGFSAGAILLAASLTCAQDEQSSASRESAATRFWTQPRVQQNPPAASSTDRPQTAPTTSQGDPAQQLAIENETLKATWTPGSSRITVVFKPSGRTFLTDADFNTSGGAAKIASTTDKTFGEGKTIEVSYPGGDRDVVMLFPKLPFALFRSSLRNSGTAATVTRTVRPFHASVDLGKPAAQLRTLGTGGLLAPDRNPGSYEWLAVADPQSRNGVVFGLISHDRGDGVLFSKGDGARVRVGAQIDYGRLRLEPGSSADLETLAVGYFDDARIGLELWADAVAKFYKIQLPPQPIGYCTWYSRPHGGASDEQHLAEQSAFAAKHLAPFGFNLIQIDDGWQSGFKRSSPSSPKKDFRTHNPTGSYPSGMKLTADRIKADGLIPGIWFMPFAGTYADPFFTNHLDWFVKAPGGAPYDTPWGGTSLDMTYPPARAHLSNVVHSIANEWGYTYFKIDGLWTGTATRQLYVNSGFKEDDIGDAVFHDPNKSNIEAYRDGLKLLRAVAGPKVFVLGCNGPQNMRSYGGAMGLVDGMRVGPDNGSEWNRLTRGTIFGSRHYFLHGRVWYNDPDPVYVRSSMPVNHAQLICSWVALSDQLNLSSEWLPGLPPERLDILKRSMPNHRKTARPVDFFEEDPPRIWLVSDTEHASRRDVIGLFNWQNGEQNIDYPLDRLGLDASSEYVAFDYWSNTPVASIKGRLQITVPGQSCLVLAVRAKANHPQLLSTSRHVTQGMVDVLEEKWTDSGKTLNGRSKLVGGDPYELRIVGDLAASTIEVSDADKAAGVKASLAPGDKLLRANIESPSSREVSWTVRFK